MSTEPAAPVVPQPLVGAISADTSVVAAHIGVLNLNVGADALAALVRAAGLVVAAGGADPSDAEINAQRDLSDRYMFEPALAGLTRIRERIREAPLSTRAQFRIANNAGVCLMALHRPAEALVEFNRAVSLEPTSDLARVNLASALHASGNSIQALAVCPASPADPAQRANAASLRIAAWSSLGEHDRIDSFLSAEAWSHHDARVQLTLAKHHSSNGDSASALRALELPVNDPETTLEACLAAADCHLGGVDRAGRIEESGGQHGSLVPLSPSPSAEALRVAHALLIRALGVCPDEARPLRADLHARIGMVLALLGERDAAISAFNEASMTAPRPLELAVVNHAALLIEGHDFHGAAAVIRGSGLADRSPHIKLQLATCLVATDAHQAAVSLLASSWRGLPEPHRTRASVLLLDAARAAKRADLVDELLAELHRDGGEAWEVQVGLAVHYSVVDRRDEASAAYRLAIELAKSDVENSLHIREAFARAQYSWGDWAGCVSTLEGLPAQHFDDGAATAFVVSLYNMDDLARAHQVTTAILENRSDVPNPIVEVAAHVASRAGDLTRAIALLRRLIGYDSARLRNINELAHCYLRAGDQPAALDALLRPATASANGWDNPHDVMNHAYLLCALGHATALGVGFQSWLRGRDDASVQLRFVGLFLSRERGEDGALELATVAAGATVCLTDTASGRERLLSILPDGAPVPDASTWVTAADPLAKRVIGKDRGDTVPGPSGPLTQVVYRIDRIYSNFVRAFQETISGFQERFPEAEGLWKVEFETGNVSEIAKLLLVAQGSRSQVKRLLAAHLEGNLPLSLLAAALNRSIPVAWSALVHDDELGGRLVFSRGADRELAVAGGVLDRAVATPVFLDYSALMTMCLLDAEAREALVALTGPLVVTQALLDSLTADMLRAGPKGNGEGMSVSVGEDGRLRAGPLGDERGFLGTVLTVARSVASPASTYATLAPSDARVVAEKLLGEPTTATLWEAAAVRGYIICDDMALARLAHAEHRTLAASIQAIAWAGLARGKLPLPMYAAIVERLALARYQFITVNEHVVLAVLERHNWRTSREVCAVFGCLAGPSCDSKSAARVGALVIKAALLDPAAALYQSSLVDTLLASLTDGHDAPQMIRLLRGLLAKMLWLAPVHFGRIDQTLAAWLTARLGSSD